MPEKNSAFMKASYLERARFMWFAKNVFTWTVSSPYNGSATYCVNEYFLTGTLGEIVDRMVGRMPDDRIFWVLRARSITKKEFTFSYERLGND